MSELVFKRLLSNQNSGQISDNEQALTFRYSMTCSCILEVQNKGKYSEALTLRSRFLHYPLAPYFLKVVYFL